MADVLTVLPMAVELRMQTFARPADFEALSK